MSASPGEELILAARSDDVPSVLRLLDEGVHVDYQGAKRFTALLWAARCGHVNVINALLQREANVHHVNNLNRTALNLAAGFGQQQVVQVLLRAGANVNHADRDGYTALRNAACYGHLAVAQMLIEAGADLNCVDKRALSALVIAARKERPLVLHTLIENGAELEISDRFGRTALFTPHIACVQTLCQANANVHHVDNDGDTPLTYAAVNAQSPVVKLLLNAGADPHHVNSYGANALMLAAACGNEDTVGVLLEANVDVNRANQHASTALMWASHHAQTDIVKTLLNANAQVNAIDKQGNTAIHFALDRCIIDRSQAVASILVEYGADLHIANLDKDTPLSLLPSGSNLRRTLLEQFSDDVDKMWHRFMIGVQTSVTTEWLLEVLRSTNIRSLFSLLAAHNLLLLLVRTGQFTERELSCLRGSAGYLLENVYLPVSKLRLNREEHVVASVVIRYAEAIGFIPECSAVWVSHAIEIRSEIRENRLLLQIAMEKVMDEICSLHTRVYQLEEWTQRAAEEFQRLAQNSEKMVDDMKQMCCNLNELHRNLRQQQRRLIYTAIARTVLSFVPVFGKALCDATYAGIELLCGLTTEDMVEIGTDVVKGAISLGIALDMSDPKHVRELTSAAFLPQLEPIARERLEFVVAQSDFRCVEALHRELLTVDEPIASDGFMRNAREERGKNVS